MLDELEKSGKSPVSLEWFRDDALLHSYKFDWLESAEVRQRVIDRSIEEGVIVVSDKKLLLAALSERLDTWNPESTAYVSI